MDRFLLVLCVTLALGLRANAGGFDARLFSVSGVSTTTTETVDTETKILGTPRAFSFLGATNMTVSVRTVSGYGLSQVVRTLVAATNAMSFYRVLPESGNQYLVHDRVEMVVYTAPAGETNAEALTADGQLLVEQP